jgi:uncharacterized membrane protein
MRKEPKLLGTANLLGVITSTKGAIIATVGVPVVVVAVVAVAGGGEGEVDAAVVAALALFAFTDFKVADKLLGP